jgi:hypothetical protein
MGGSRNNTSRGFTEFNEMSYMDLQGALDRWTARLNEGKLHIINDYPGVTLDTHVFDGMHVCDKGGTPYILGAALYCMATDDRLNGDIKKRMGKISEMLQIHYEKQSVKHQNRIRKLTWNNIARSANVDNPAHFPELHGVKAAMLRNAVGPIRAIVEHFDDGRYTHLSEVLRCSERFYGMIDAYGWRFPDEAADDLVRITIKCLTHWCFLAKRSAEQGRKVFHVIPKMHYWIHLAHNSRYVNPRMSWCYADEDFIGRIKLVAAASVFGRGPYKLAPALLRRLQ